MIVVRQLECCDGLWGCNNTDTSDNVDCCDTVMTDRNVVDVILQQEWVMTIVTVVTIIMIKFDGAVMVPMALVRL